MDDAPLEPVAACWGGVFDGACGFVVGHFRPPRLGLPILRRAHPAARPGPAYLIPCSRVTCSPCGVEKWGRGDSNSYAFRHMILNHARLPIPTLPHRGPRPSVRARRDGEPHRTRTCNLLIKSQLLYQLKLAAPGPTRWSAERSTRLHTGQSVAQPLLEKAFRHISVRGNPRGCQGPRSSGAPCRQPMWLPRGGLRGPRSSSGTGAHKRRPTGGGVRSAGIDRRWRWWGRAPTRGAPTGGG